jgi:hypothetical protein
VLNHYDADIEAWSLPHMQDLPNDTALRYDYSQQRSGARFVLPAAPQPRNDPPSEASWRTSDWAIAAIAVGACAAAVFGSALEPAPPAAKPVPVSAETMRRMT